MAVDDLYTWTNGDGEVLDLTDRTLWGMLPSDGFGLPDLELIVRETPAGDGGTYVSTRLKPRSFKMRLLLKATNWPDQQARRAALVSAFSPTKGIGTWTVYRANGTTRAIDAVIKSGLQFIASGRKGMSRIEEIDFLAPASYWYDPAPVAGSFPFGTMTGGGNLPQNLPFNLGSSNMPAVVSVTNAGDLNAYPVFTIPGPSIGPTITNRTTGQIIKWNGTLSDGQTLTIDCSFFNPTVSVTDIYGFMTSGWGSLDISSSFFPIRRGSNQLIFMQSNAQPINPTYSFKSVYSGI